MIDPRGTVYLDARGRACVTAREAARRLGVRLHAIQQALATGRLPATKAGAWYNAPWLIPVSALDAWEDRISPEARVRLSVRQRATEQARRDRSRVIADLIGAPPPK